MKKIILFLAIISLFFLNVESQAATHTAASGSLADVTTAYNLCTYGDTLAIPTTSGTTPQWTSGLAITKDIKIKGAGTGASGTTIFLNFTDDNNSEAFFHFTPDATARANIDSLSDSNTFEVNGIVFVGNSNMNLKYAVWITNNNATAVRRVSVHDCKFHDIYRSVIPDDEVYGVMYDNYLYDSGACKPTARNLSSWDDNPQTLGSADGWYVEDNVFSFIGAVAPTSELITSCGHGAGQVIRYNTLTGACQLYIDAHGNQTSGVKGTQRTEIYGNDLGSTAVQTGIDMRGGRCLIFFNKIQDGLLRIREEYNDAASGTALANACVEAGPQICADNCVCQKINHSYFFNNRKSSDSSIVLAVISQDMYDGVNTNSPLELVADREFWNFETAGSGTTGCGCGNALPGTCDGDNEGFWLTDQDCTQIVAANLGANPSTPISGTLYRCTAANTWTAWYTPYTYPHALRGGSCALSGTATEEINESDIVAGGKTIIFTITGDTFVGTLGDNNSYTTDFTASMPSNRNDPNGWNNVVLAGLDHTHFSLNAGCTQYTCTLPAFGAYDIPQTEEKVTPDPPGVCLTSGTTPGYTTPTDFSIGVEASGGGSATVGIGMAYSKQGRECVYNKNGVELVAE